jgi:tape measure domain-containing protein
MATLNSIFKLTDGYSRTVDKVMAKTDAASSKLMGASKSADSFNNKLNGMNKNASLASSGLGKLVGTVVSLAAVQKTLNLADEMTLTSARLDLVNDGLQTTAKLQDMVFASAQRARGEYASTASSVAKLVLLAKDSFDSNKEIIAFTEIFQKMAKVSGSSLSESTNAMYQLTQAMAAGRLQGDEFRSIMENAPMLAQAIAKSLGKSTGELREMAADGLITSNVIKTAMFSAADEVNAKFADIPMTFSQAWTVIQNTLLQQFLPVIQKIAEGGQWIGDNWDSLEPIFYGAAIAVGAYAFGLGIMKIAAIQADIANKGLKATLLSNPLMWVALLIGIIVAVIAKWVQSVGGIDIAWQIAVDKMLTGLDWLGIGFATATFAIVDFAEGMKADFLSTTQEMVNGGIDLINQFITAANKIPGIAFDTIDNVTFGATAKIEYEASKAGRAEILKNMKYDTRLNSSLRQSKIADAQAALDKGSSSFDMADFGTSNNPLTIEGTGANGSVEVDMSDENIQYLRDIAERDYINKFSTATLAPNITVTFGDVHEEADIDKVTGRLKLILQEEIATAAEGVYDV